MSKLEFRDLHADEIDCRVAMISEKGLSLLLYKDARCDMNILDETVGSTSWQRHHGRDNANCIVSIWDDEKKQWIEKEDTGTESNTEAQKGLASDSFKRACFNWGIGRELYTAPFIWVPAEKYKLNKKKLEQGKYACDDSFSVGEIIIESKKIVGISIRNNRSKEVVYSYGRCKNRMSDVPEVVTSISEPEPKAAPTIQSVGDELKSLCAYYGYDLRVIAAECKLTKDSVLKDCIRAVNYVKKKAMEDGLV